MAEPIESRSELYLRFSHRSMVALFFLILTIGGASLAMALQPDGGVSRWLAKAPWLWPVATVIIIAALQSSLRGHRWNPDSPEAKAILQDEWRRTSMDRAMRAAFIIVLAAQLPLGLLLTLAVLPPLRTAMAMAVSTITLGMTTLVGLFLFFGREVNDGR